MYKKKIQDISSELIISFMPSALSIRTEGRRLMSSRNNWIYKALITVLSIFPLELRLVFGSSSELPPVCLNLGAGQIRVSVGQRADMCEAWLIESFVLLKRWRGHSKLHFTAQVLKIWVHGQRQAQPLCEEAFCRAFAARDQSCEILSNVCLEYTSFISSPWFSMIGLTQECKLPKYDCMQFVFKSLYEYAIKQEILQFVFCTSVYPRIYYGKADLRGSAGECRKPSNQTYHMFKHMPLQPETSR